MPPFVAKVGKISKIFAKLSAPARLQPCKAGVKATFSQTLADLNPDQQATCRGDYDRTWNYENIG